MPVRRGNAQAMTGIIVVKSSLAGETRNIAVWDNVGMRRQRSITTVCIIVSIPPPTPPPLRERVGRNDSAVTGATMECTKRAVVLMNVFLCNPPDIYVSIVSY